MGIGNLQKSKDLEDRSRRVKKQNLCLFRKREGTSCCRKM